MCSCAFRPTFNLLFSIVLANSVRYHSNVEKHLEHLIFKGSEGCSLVVYSLLQPRYTTS